MSLSSPVEPLGVEDGRRVGSSSRGRTKIVLLSISTAAAIALVLQNTEVVEFHLLFWTLRMSRIVLLVLAMVLGFVSGYLVASTRRRYR